jgi:adsorption protein B
MPINMDSWTGGSFALLLCWILLNGIDDLFIGLVWLFLPQRSEHSFTSKPGVPERRTAIFVPLWQEHRVIERMVAQNTGSIHYANYDIFIGCYPNDPLTSAAIHEAMKRFPRVHMAKVPHDGPTSKADCLNWIYQRMLLFEEETGARFEMVLTHDAEDVIHPAGLTCVNQYAAEGYDMIQIPVLALPTPWWELTHGVYCDDFAQMELIDMPVRQVLGGFIPSNGVGTAFSRRILERIGLAYSNRIFEPACLTEDYENGFRVEWLGGRQIFVRLPPPGGQILATREYFPRQFGSAVRQRTRWITGIALQGWELHGIAETVSQIYWFWRDRKNVVGNLVSPLANLVTVVVMLRGGLHLEGAIRNAAIAGLAIMWLQTALRMYCSARIYGAAFAMAVPLRMIWGNCINGAATLAALRNYVTARWRGHPLRWVKTEHAYPNRAALLEHLVPLEEILVLSGYMQASDLQNAIATKPAGRSLPAHLLKLQLIDEASLYEAISLEHKLPLGKPDEVYAAVTRSFPLDVSRRWKVLPFKVAAGSLHVAGPEPPTEEMNGELRTFSTLEIRFQLVTPTEFEELRREYLTEPVRLHSAIAFEPGFPVAH